MINYRVVQIMPADGWEAEFNDGTVQPLVGWALAEKLTFDSTGLVADASREPDEQYRYREVLPMTLEDNDVVVVDHPEIAEVRRTLTIP